MTTDNEDIQSTAVTNIEKGAVTGKFYFSDETGYPYGPYDTIIEAELALRNYVEYLNNGPKAVNKTNNLPQCSVKYYGG